MLRAKGTLILIRQDQIVRDQSIIDIRVERLNPGLPNGE